MKKIFLLALSFTLASCAPISFQPGSASNPFKVSLFEPASAEQNSEIHVVTQAMTGMFTRTQADDDLDAATNAVNPQVGQKHSTNVFWLRINDVKVPTGVSIELVNQRASREITDVGRTTFSFVDRLELYFKVKVASTTNPGRSIAVVDLINVSDPSRKGFATIPLQIVKPQVK
jgi:hypothetical protein